MSQEAQPTALVVDDEPNVRNVVTLALKAAGFACSTAADGVEALGIMTQATFDLVITDLEMPRMRGLDLVEAMRAAGTETPVIVMTGYAQFEFARHALRLGVSDYLVKPVENLEVIQTAARRAVADRASACSSDGAPSARGRPATDALRMTGGGSIARAEQLSGEDIAGYRVLDRLGEGRMGVVYRAMQLSMNRIVALKALHSDLARDRALVERFVREARAAARLDHPNLVRGIDVGADSGIYYFAMEYVDGPSAAQRMEQSGRLEEADATRIAIQIARGLEHAWAAGLVHRDVTPSNILLSRAGVALLADLGIARDIRSDSPALTTEGTVLGTPWYMAPEQIAQRAAIDHRVDVYGLGATLYHLVAGVPPFNSPNPVEVLAMHLRDKPAPAFEHRAGLSIELCSVIAKMMQKSPAQRYGTACDLIQDLSLALEKRVPVHAPLVC